MNKETQRSFRWAMVKNHVCSKKLAKENRMSEHRFLVMKIILELKLLKMFQPKCSMKKGWENRWMIPNVAWTNLCLLSLSSFKMWHWWGLKRLRSSSVCMVCDFLLFFFAGSCLGWSRAERLSVSWTEVLETLCLQQPKEMFNISNLCKSVQLATGTEVLTKFKQNLQLRRFSRLRFSLRRFGSRKKRKKRNVLSAVFGDRVCLERVLCRACLKGIKWRSLCMSMILTLFGGCLRIVSRSCARSSDHVLLSESSG